LKPPVKALVAVSVSLPEPVLAKLPSPLRAGAWVTSFGPMSMVPVLPAAETRTAERSAVTPVPYLRVASPVKVTSVPLPKAPTPESELLLSMVKVPARRFTEPSEIGSVPSIVSSPAPFFVKVKEP